MNYRVLIKRFLLNWYEYFPVFCPLTNRSIVITQTTKYTIMKEFMLIFRNNDPAPDNPSPEQVQERMNWLAGIAAQNKLADKGNRLSMGNAKTVQSGNIVTDGPFTEIKEFIRGYVVVKTSTVEEAIDLAKENPILKMGGSVEVRAILTPGEHN
jgi:hypothetical protein